MAARKLAQEVDKCFKKVAEGVQEFEAIYEKIEQSNNPAQKDKLEDNLKREIKKLQRLRDQIKTWAASNDIKDKAPLLEHRRLIETQMEKFKAVEKAMKTKAYSKEGLSAAAKLDPKEQAKLEAGEFLSQMVDELEQQIETLEAESESIQATMKRGKGHGAKADRISEIERIIERHKWHQGKLELIRRSLENGGVETEQVNELEESIRYYVTDGMNEDFMDDEGIYDDLNLEEEEDAYGMNVDNDKGSSQDAQSIQDEPEPEPKPASVPAAKQRTPADTVAASSIRRSSAQLKSPLPTLATVHNNTMPSISNTPASNVSMKPASLPTRPAEGLKYASAAAAAAASDKSGVGIAPLPPPPTTNSSLPASQHVKTSAANSPSVATVQPVAQERIVNAVPPAVGGSITNTPVPSKTEPAKNVSSRDKVSAPVPAATATTSKATPEPEAVKTQPKGRNSPHPCRSSRTNVCIVPQTNGASNGIKPIEEVEEEESIYHLPASLQDLIESYEVTKKCPASVDALATQRMHAAAVANKPSALDTELPRPYYPDVRYHTHNQFPQEPLAIFEDPRLYQRIDPDTLFYVFYYKQGTYQQYLAAKALKDQSWRFHKQYQTWFQRHEEPKSITEEFEQGTYRFFDYESTWMNRRKADFKFTYKFLEDEV
ncbi:Not1 N-terminal domain, CCR4-Not complex component-domain-containing protein [Neurospora hispaniola]|uniref:General negative regulator of transcription subunit n=1 Tax=Neurospora hispaniola TaxID=588809 RepID=A0AAJ0I7D1_9PEZI|nr:Not1 N-terminal domain, CCR4-Not complex component-domain-containing protein [Neurospora hispaniola]